MYPNIIIGNMVIPSWYTLLFIGIIIPVSLAIYLRPANFPLNRKEILILAVFVVVAALFGARLLFVLLHFGVANFRLSELVSFQGGFAYFGALILSILVLWLYSILKKMNFLSLSDYIIPFLMLSQAFVRIGCLLAGCCYGKPTNGFFGVVFKTGDGLRRHPTQAYEALLLFLIYFIMRFIYKRKTKEAGFTFFITLILYALGRFLIEYLRTDSPVIFLNLTMAQVICLSIALVGLLCLRGISHERY